ncbi:MAG: aspartate aminotransferase family protein [Streptosporangiaceae bacterium]
MTYSQVIETYQTLTPTSAEISRRAMKVMPAGVTRRFGYHLPYPLTIERGSGPYLIDVDGNRYVDLVYNGLSLIHGHAYPPVTRALQAAAERGSGWLVGSREQVAFAEQLCDRLATFELLRFTNSGTEAAMLAVKVARAATGRPFILKAWGGYHGSYDDLEAGLEGRGQMPGRVLLAEFGNADSFEAVLAEHGSKIAAVVLEPLQYTGNVTTAPPGFLQRVQEAARRSGALFVLDDCLMLRLAPGGSAEKYGLQPDVTFLGKFIGGGIPMGVVGGRADVMNVLDPRREPHLYHSGSFNGNLLACVAGSVSLSELTAGRIDEMDGRARRIRSFLENQAAAAGIALTTAGDGSVMCAYLQAHAPAPTEERQDRDSIRVFHLAALNNGVFLGPGGEMAMSTVLGDDAVAHVEAGLTAALTAVAQALEADSALTVADLSDASR